MEDFLFALLRIFRFLESENSGEIVCVIISLLYSVRLVFQHEIELSVFHCGTLQVDALVIQKALQTELCCDILGTEECVYPCLGRIQCVIDRISVDYEDILKQ